MIMKRWTGSLSVRRPNVGIWQGCGSARKYTSTRSETCAREIAAD